MNIGGRIVKRLNDLGWKRKDLLERVPDLTSQALFNLIKRDSVRSEWDEPIAEALGVSVLWLVYGKEPEYSATDSTTTLQAESPPDNIVKFSGAHHEAIDEVIELMTGTDELGKGMILASARAIAKERRAKTSKRKFTT